MGDIRESLVELYDEFEKDSEELSGIPSGFKHLDRLTGGFQESDLVIIGARPSVGKTAFALNIALNAAADEMSLIFSLEMSRKQLLKRAASYSGNISNIKMRNPKRFFLDEDWSKLTKANFGGDRLSAINCR